VEGFFGTSDPTDIAVGPDGALWFTEAYGNNIGRITTGGSITEYPVPTAGAQPFGIVAGPDNALWFTEFVGGNIGRITTAGVVTNEYPTTTPNSGPWGITAGPDGNLWFVENVPPFNVGRITTGGVVTEYATPAIYPESIAVGSDNALWFSGIGRVTTAGVVNPTLYQIPSYSGTNSLASGPDGAIWFTEGQQNNIGRITTAGVFTEYPVPTPLSNPYGITAGPDGNVWFTEQASGPCQFGFCSHPNKIGRIVPP
jgi:virginiamycin B lyase